MFEIDHLDFIGNREFDNLLDYLFGGCRTKRVVGDDGVESTRVYFPRRKPVEGNCDISPNEQPTKTPSWRKEVRGNADIPEWTQTPSKPVAKPEPKSILEMLEDGDERLKRLLGDIIDQKLAEREKAKDEPKPLKNDPYVFIANRLTFLIQSKHPLVFDTSNIKTDEKSMTVAVNEGKTIPKLGHIDELGFITSEVNRDEEIQSEIREYLDGTEHGNIFCFPTVTRDGGEDGEPVFAVKFVVYPRK